MRAGIGRRINLAIGLGFALVLLVGGVSVLLAWAISREVEQGRQHGLEAESVDRIHSILHYFIGDLYLVLQGGRVLVDTPPEQTLEKLKREIAAYEALERGQRGEEARAELAQLGELKSLVAQLEAASLKGIETSTRGQPPTPAELAVVNDLAFEQASKILEELHGLHRKKFQRTIDESQRRMVLIFAVYVAFAFCGGLLLLLANRFLSKNLVLPISRLGQAALHIAGGGLSQRVPVGPDDEVGQLSRAFNVMAQRLEAHEAERMSFQGELERQVKERTRELEETAARLRAAQAQLIRSERIAVTGQIAAGVTHEIRTPLNSLAINVQLLRREISRKVSPSLRETLSTLATVEYEITRINRILEEFVKFARLPTPRLEPVEAAPLLEEIVALLGLQAAEVGVRIETRSESPVAPVRGDRDQLREVFLNLGQNALQAMPNGGTLGVEVSQDGEWVAIAVTDSGPGIPEAERERIFLPFVTTKTDGLGLGLAIVRRIVEEHGGSVACQNRPGEGAAFVVRLPAARPGNGG